MNKQNLDLIPHTMVLKFSAVYPTLKSAERQAADFILANPNEAKDMTISAFAEKAKCSEATIVRLSKRLGYDGFPKLRAELASISEDEDHSGLGYPDIEETDEPEAVARKVIDASINALRDTATIVSTESYRNALQALLKATNIMFCGVGDAALVAMEAYQRFVRIGHRCFASADPDLQLVMANQLRKGDVAVAISHSGKSVSVVNAVKVARKAGATTVAITNYPVSPLTKSSDIVVQTAVFSKPIGDEVISARVAQLCIIESLYVNYLLRKGDRVMTTLSESNEVVKMNKLWTEV